MSEKATYLHNEDDDMSSASEDSSEVVDSRKKAEKTKWTETEVTIFPLTSSMHYFLFFVRTLSSDELYKKIVGRIGNS